MDFDHLPTINACFNAASACFLIAGYLAIRKKKVQLHRICMGSAFTASLFFLAGYLTYHAMHGTTRYPHHGWIRDLYFFILITHTILAAAVPPLVITTFTLALKNKIERHKAWAKWTLPIWFYVSVTGVVIYGMLYLGKS